MIFPLSIVSLLSLVCIALLASPIRIWRRGQSWVW